MTQNLELVEKLVEKTGVSYGEAKAMLEQTDWDILEAIIRLEAAGRVRGPETAQYSTSGNSGTYQQNQSQNQNQQSKQCKDKANTGENFKKSAKSFGDWLKDVFDKGNHNSLQVFRRDDKIVDLPVTAFVILLIFCFWVVIPIMVVGLFLGCRYSFSGNELGKPSVNNAMGKATDIADNIKNEFTKSENKGN